MFFKRLCDPKNMTLSRPKGCVLWQLLNRNPVKKIKARNLYKRGVFADLLVLKTGLVHAKAMLYTELHPSPSNLTFPKRKNIQLKKSSLVASKHKFFRLYILELIHALPPLFVLRI